MAKPELSDYSQCGSLDDLHENFADYGINELFEGAICNSCEAMDRNLTDMQFYKDEIDWLSTYIRHRLHVEKYEKVA